MSSHTEARALWRAILRQVPDPIALCLMPDHVHLLHHQDVTGALGLALRGYARWRNQRLGQRGPLWRRLTPPELVKDGVKLRRSERYIHLNPCRAKLVGDPLAWPWSTHRDRVGLAWPCAVPTRTDPAAFHRYVSSDPTVAVDGTLLPYRLDGGTAEQVYAAVSALTRSPAERLALRGPARTLWIQSLRNLTSLTQPAIAREVGVCLSTVQRLPPLWTPEIRLVRRLLGDRRFPALGDGPLAWTRRYSRNTKA